MSPSNTCVEGFTCLERGDGYRLGVYEDPDQMGSGEWLEILLRLLHPGKQMDLAAFRDRLERLGRLEKEGYTIEAEDGGWVSCVRPLPSEREERRRQLALARSVLCLPS